MKRMHSLAALTAAVAILAAGCGGAAEKPAVPVPPSSAASAPAAPAKPEIAKPATVGFEVVENSALPPELAPWREMKKVSGSARVGDFVYVLLMGGDEATDATEIVPTQVELTTEPKPLISVNAVLVPGKTEPGAASPRAYIRIPYAVSLPVPSVQIQVDTQRSQAQPAASPAAPAASSPDTPVSSPAPPAVTPPPQQPPATGTPSTPLVITMIRENELPASLADWKLSTVQVPNGVARYAEGALYLLVSAGQRNSGGYSVEIRSVRQRDRALLVTAVLNRPKPGQMVTQAVTYPRAYARIGMTGKGDVQVIVDWQ